MRFRPAGLHLRDVQATFSGIRPVVDTGQRDPSKESRESVLWDEYGLLTITGGKLTTFRLMALEALRAVRNRLPHHPRFSDQTAHARSDRYDVDRRSRSGVWRCACLDATAQTHPNSLQAAQPMNSQPIDSAPALWAELRWAARDEGVVHLDDLLLRRVRLGLLLPQGGVAYHGSHPVDRAAGTGLE